MRVFPNITRSYEDLGEIKMIKKDDFDFEKVSKRGEREIFFSEGVWMSVFQKIDNIAILCDIIKNDEIIGILIAEVLPEEN